MLKYFFIGTFIAMISPVISTQFHHYAGLGHNNSAITLQSECEVLITVETELLFECRSQEGILYLLFTYSSFPDNHILLAHYPETDRNYSLYSSDTTPIPLEVSAFSQQEDSLFQRSLLFDTFQERFETAENQWMNDLTTEMDTTITIQEAVTDSLETADSDSLQTDNKAVMVRLEFTTDTSYPGENRSYTLLVDEHPISFSVNYPRELLVNRFLNDVLESSGNDLLEGEYANALRSLENAFTTLPSDRFISEARNVIEKWGKGVTVSREETDALIKTLQESLLFQDGQDWTARQSVELLHQYLLFSEEQMATPEYLLEGYRELIDWTDGDIEFRFKALMLQFDISYKNERYWECIDFLQAADDLKPDSFNASERIRECLMKAFDQDHRDQRYDSIYLYGRRYHNLFHQDLTARYIYSRAAKDQQQAKIWAAELEWLLNMNLSDQQWISRRELQRELNEAYQMSMQFEKALELNRRVFLEENDEKELLLFVTHLRARMLKPMFQVLSSYVLHSNSLNVELGQYIHFYSKNYLSAIYLQSVSDDRHIMLFNSTPDKEPEPRVFTGVDRDGTFFADDVMEKAWFVYPADGNLLIIAMDTGSSATDLNHINLILNNPDLPNVWQPLIRTNEMQGAVASATVLSALFEAEPISETDRFIDNAAQMLSENENLRFMLIREITGETGFTLKEADEEVTNSTSWKESFQKELLYHQILRTGGDDILDVTHSLMREGTTIGHLKIGFNLIN